MNRRKLVLAVALGSFGFLGQADVQGADPAPITIRVVTPFAAGHILADTAFRFKEQIEFKSKGKVLVTVTTSRHWDSTNRPSTPR